MKKNFALFFFLLTHATSMYGMRSSNDLTADDLDVEYSKAIKAGSCDKLNKAVKKTSSLKNLKVTPPSSPENPARLGAQKKPSQDISEDSTGSGKTSYASETDLKYIAILKQKSEKYEKRLEDPLYLRILKKLKKGKDEGKVAVFIAASSGYGLYELLASADFSGITFKEVMLLLNSVAAISYAAHKTYKEYFTKKDLDDKWAKSLAMLTLITQKLAQEETPRNSDSGEFQLEIEEKDDDE